MNALRVIEVSPRGFKFVARLAESALESCNLGSGALLEVFLLASQLFFLMKESAVLLLEAFVMTFEVFSVPVELAPNYRQVLLGFQPGLGRSSLRCLDERLPMLVSDGSNEVAGRCCYLCFELTAQCDPQAV